MVCMDRIAGFMADRMLVSIRREGIDPGGAMQGFILGFSDELVLIQYIYDFIPDGLLVLRCADITSVECSATDVFQKSLLVTEGVFQKICFDQHFDLRCWRSILMQLSTRYPLMILENEQLERRVFMLGQIERISEPGVLMKCFTGTARWKEDEEEMLFSNLTACQVDTHYINVYQRYFDKRVG